MKIDNVGVATPSLGRLDWVDVAKGLGIVLMFYGHYLQRGIDVHNASAVDQLRLIYSFHMPMFFVAAGFFFHPTDRVLNRTRQLALRRLVPVVFFSALLLPIWLQAEIRHHLPLWHDMESIGADYAEGFPDLDWVTWFLVCLFVCECLAAVFIHKAFRVRTLIGIGFTCLAVGLIFCAHSETPNQGVLYTIGRTWFISEALVALGFFAIGYALFPYLQTIVTRRVLTIAVLTVATIIVVTTFRLNHPTAIAVMMAAREHGNPGLFALTAFSGTTAVIMLGMNLRNNRILAAIGRNALLLLGLNGLFFHYVNPLLERFMTPPDSEVVVALVALLVTSLSLALCAPIAHLINQWLPQLVGKTRSVGPWLPAFERRQVD